jgi:hypothetical protein
MLAELLVRSVDEMDRSQIVEECRELEDAYAEALKDNAGFDALSKIWKRIQELNRGLERSSGGARP